MSLETDSLQGLAEIIAKKHQTYLIDRMLIQVFNDHSRCKSIDVFGQSPHMSSIGIRYWLAIPPQLPSVNVPYMPVGATIKSFPKAALPVPANNLKLSLSPEVMGAGSNPGDLCDTVMCLVELWDGMSKNEIV